MTYDIGNPGPDFEQAQKCGRFKLLLSHVVFFTEVSAPPLPRDVFLSILPNNSLSIKWLPPAEEYRIRVRSYVISVLEEDERERKFTMNSKSRELVVPLLGNSKSRELVVPLLVNSKSRELVLPILGNSKTRELVVPILGNLKWVSLITLFA